MKYKRRDTGEIATVKKQHILQRLSGGRVKLFQLSDNAWWSAEELKRFWDILPEGEAHETA